MSKISCDIVKDILPLYYDNVCSNDSKKIVEEHLSGCDSCKNELDRIEEDIKIPKEEIKKNRNDANVIKKISSFWNRSRVKSFIKGVIISALLFSLISGILTWVFAIGTKAHSEDVNITTTINEITTPLEAGAIRLELTNGKRLRVTTRPVYGVDENGKKTEVGYVIKPYSVQPFPGKDNKKYTIGYPPTSDFTVTVSFKDKDIVYSMTDKGLSELK
ncbi:zf-HC2 domain-containing protein [Aquibacillus sp. 3ASR75-11]|uniref:Zf-HC2 domain-containing protein n=1 Tax=Terrihalobacillus insolitus TaxID=2950438 RepID=A0A9X3WSS1_9BACI|nr:zf-HC2 domain-containing protein [Terrihalobacillus insolitus]MDC3425147.1 zf-HC2 domain-containing protein [Terrihalobacillus insolitus]